MLRGWLIGNHFLQSPQFTTLYGRFSEAAYAAGVALRVRTNVEVAAELAAVGHPCLPDFVLFWDKDVRLCRQLERLGVRVFNSARAIQVCDDKALTYQVLQASGRVPQPETLVVPKVYGPQEWDDTLFPDAAIQALGLPLVMKQAFGSFGEQVHLARSRQDVVAFLDGVGAEPALLQRFVAASAGTDVRLQMVGGECVAAMRRRSLQGDFRANIVNGGTAERYSPSRDLVALARDVCQVIGLDFAGVDFLFDGQGLPLVCEVNSNAHFATIERLTGADVAGSIIGHVVSALEGSA